MSALSVPEAVLVQYKWVLPYFLRFQLSSDGVKHKFGKVQWVDVPTQQPLPNSDAAANHLLTIN